MSVVINLAVAIVVGTVVGVTVGLITRRLSRNTGRRYSMPQCGAQVIDSPGFPEGFVPPSASLTPPMESPPDSSWVTFDKGKGA